MASFKFSLYSAVFYRACLKLVSVILVGAIRKGKPTNIEAIFADSERKLFDIFCWFRVKTNQLNSYNLTNLLERRFGCHITGGNSMSVNIDLNLPPYTDDVFPCMPTIRSLQSMLLQIWQQIKCAFNDFVEQKWLSSSPTHQRPLKNFDDLKPKQQLKRLRDCEEAMAKGGVDPAAAVLLMQSAKHARRKKALVN
jgi:hypothetical protein